MSKNRKPSLRDKLEAKELERILDKNINLKDLNKVEKLKAKKLK